MRGTMPFAEPVTRVVPLPERVSPLRGEFVDAALEQDFRASTLSRVLPQQRAGLVLWAALMIGFVVPDYLDLGAVPHFWILAVYRVVFALLLLATVVALRRKPTLALHGHVLMGLALLGYPFFFLLYGLRPEIRALNTGAIMVIQLMLFLFVPVRVALAAPVALFGAFGATLSIWATTVDASVKVGTAFLVALPAVLGYAAALRQQKTERQEFLLRRQLQDANRELQDEVARRVALQDELERHASTDLLTELPNRRALAERFATESVRAQRRSEALSLAMFDLDHFKRVNDTHGHAGGDAVLRAVGEVCLLSWCRPGRAGRRRRICGAAARRQLATGGRGDAALRQPAGHNARDDRQPGGTGDSHRWRGPAAAGRRPEWAHGAGRYGPVRRQAGRAQPRGAGATPRHCGRAGLMRVPGQAGSVKRGAMTAGGAQARRTRRRARPG